MIIEVYPPYEQGKDPFEKRGCEDCAFFKGYCSNDYLNPLFNGVRFSSLLQQDCSYWKPNSDLAVQQIAAVENDAISRFCAGFREGFRKGLRVLK